MITTLVIFLVWSLYLSIGLFWINWLVNNNLIKEYNVIGSLFMIVIWPFLLPFFRKKK